MGGGRIGQAVFNAATTASALNVQGGTTLGRDIFTVGTTVSGQTVLGGGVVGRQIFEAVGTASAQGLFGIVPAATTAEARTKTNTSVAMTPAVMKDSPFAPRAYVAFNSAGTITQIQRVSSVNKQADGIFRIRWSPALPTANYVVAPFAAQSGQEGGLFANVYVSGGVAQQTASAVDLGLFNADTPTNLARDSAGLAGCTVFCSGA